VIDQLSGRPTSITEAPPVPTFQIVPLWGLPVVAVVLVLLIGAIASNGIWALNFFHVAGGGLWTGVDLFVGFIIGPILGQLSVRARVEFATRFMPRMVLLMPTLVIVTLTSGWQLSQHLGLINLPYPQHWWLTASYIVVGVMAVVALGILEPANLAVLFELKKPRPDGELIAGLMRRFTWAAGITGLMQVATLLIMTHITLS